MDSPRKRSDLSQSRTGLTTTQSRQTKRHRPPSQPLVEHPPRPHPRTPCCNWPRMHSRVRARCRGLFARFPANLAVETRIISLLAHYLYRPQPCRLYQKLDKTRFVSNRPGGFVEHPKGHDCSSQELLICVDCSISLSLLTRSGPRGIDAGRKPRPSCQACF